MREILLVHGLWHGAWCWDEVVAGLAARSVPARALDLPMRTLDGDADVVRAALDEATTDSVVLAGHSYGGAVITAAGEHPAVAALAYFAAFALEAGESIGRVARDDYGPDDTGAAAFVVGESDVSMHPQFGPPLLYHRCPPAAAARAARLARPVGRSLFSARPGAVAWRSRPSTYVVCADDRMVAPGLQRIMASRCTSAREWDCDHSPQASRPDDVVALLHDLARRPESG